MKKFTPAFLFLALCSQIAFSQTIAVSKKDEISPELKKEAVQFLRETALDVGTLRSLENRISFSSEIANLMWLNDEKEARSMFKTIINDFTQLLAQYNAQAMATESAAGASEEFSYGGGRNNMARKFSKALSVRQQIASSLAENDAQLAFDFLTDTAQSVTAPTFRKQIEQSDSYFQTRLLNQIAAQNPETALKYGRQTLAKEFTYEHINLLKKIYAKDAEKGAAFGADILAKFKSDASSNPENFYYLNSILEMGAANLKEVSGKNTPPMFSDQSLRDFADLLARAILNGDAPIDGNASAYLTQIEKFSPAQAAQIRQKYSVNSQSGIGSKKGVLTGRTISPPPPPAARFGSDQEQQNQMVDGLLSLGAKQLSKEERQRVVAQTRKVIAGVKEPMQKLVLLSALASQVAASGDKELAVQVMDEARNSVNLQPKNYQEFLQILILTGGYARADADKAFPLLEDAIFRINDTIAAAVKIAEFMDTESEIIEDGEIQIGSFGGGMMRGLLGNLGEVNQIIGSLAKADFARTKALTNKFDRPEARILAKMIVLRGIFGDKKTADN